MYLFYKPLRLLAKLHSDVIQAHIHKNLRKPFLQTNAVGKPVRLKFPYLSSIKYMVLCKINQQYPSSIITLYLTVESIILKLNLSTF